MEKFSSVGLIGASAAAKIMGVHPNTVKRIDTNLLPFYRVGSRGDRRYRVEDVYEYLKQEKAYHIVKKGT